MDRFRRTHSLLEGHKELENQEIYFSDVASLNDPMEGFREYFWAGDTIIWVNFFKHYLLSLEHICMLAYLSEEGESLDAKDISVFIRFDPRIMENICLMLWLSHDCSFLRQPS